MVSARVGTSGLAMRTWLSIRERGRLYASSAHMNTILVFDLQGDRIGTLTPKPPDKLEGPSALALSNRKLYVLNMAGNRVSAIDLQNKQ